MLTLRFIRHRLNLFMQDNYLYVWFCCFAVCAFLGLFQYDLKKHNRDLVYWTEIFEFCYNELKHFTVVLILIVALVRAIFLVFILALNTRSITMFEEFSQKEVKKRYAQFLFIRLIADIDRIEQRYLRASILNGEEDSMKIICMAHDDIRRVIEQFRRDARKLLSPNALEVALPAHEVYRLSDEDERAVKRSRFYRMNITADYQLINSLVNP